MDELIDILDSKGRMTGRTAMKSEAHRKGLFHQTVHIWFYTSDGGVLLQQRGQEKETYPLLWDVSAAGHVGAGEPIETAAMREAEEEIGLSISESELYKIGIFKSFHTHGEDLIDNEFHHSFLCELKVPFESLQKQESEVKALAVIPISKFEDELKDREILKKYVPHELDYYNSVIREIQKTIALE